MSERNVKKSLGNLTVGKMDPVPTSSCEGSQPPVQEGWIPVLHFKLVESIALLKRGQGPLPDLQISKGLPCSQ